MELRNELINHGIIINTVIKISALLTVFEGVLSQ